MKTSIGYDPFSRPRVAAIVAIVAIACSLSTPALRAQGPPPGPRAFDSPQAAVDALIQAAESNDVPALLAIFGPDGKDIITSGDAVKDKNDRTTFAERARKKSDVSFDSASRAVLSVGEDEFPLPVPIVRSGGKWRFDAKQGREEILARRIGSNELETIAFLRGYVDAQREYATEEHDGSGILQYAQKTISTPGKHDGLSWKNADGSPGGPIGEQIAQALAKGYTNRTEPYNGYHFRTLLGQGPAARLGARDYIFKGMMIGGFAMVAWPDNYGVSGIQTFLVNHDGAVYQKDLGPNTSKIASSMKLYNPDKTWLVTEDEQ